MTSPRLLLHRVRSTTGRSSGSLRRRVVAALLGGVLVVTPALAACGGGGEGATTECSINACTVTFDRGVDASASVLGIEAKLVGVQGNEVTLEVAGQQVTVLAGNSTNVGQMEVAVQRVTDSQVVVRISQAGEGGQGG